MRKPVPTLLAAAVLTLSACTPLSPPAAPPAVTVTASDPTDLPASAGSTAGPSGSLVEPSGSLVERSRDHTLAHLDTLEVKGRAPKTGYSRAEFGQRWSDAVDVEYGRNGCDTRNDILNRDLTDQQYRPGSRDCVVVSGTLHDPYTGTDIDFVRGADTSQQVQIDHVVALSDAWQKGAQALSPDQRLAFANDPRNLLAVSGSANQAKGDSDAATWLPPNRSYRCSYVARQVEVKAAYRLWVTQAEQDAMRRVLSTCI